MANCIRCGGSLGDFDAGGDGMCSNCEAAIHSSSSTDVPCQRCGMYLPPHELRMHNSRLYCAYCIMDIQDEEKRRHGKNERRREERREGQQSGAMVGTCERCGRQTDKFYKAFGRNLCALCYFEGEREPEGGKPSAFGMLAQRVKKILGFSQKPKIIAKEPAQQQVFDLRKRKMIDEKEAQQPAQKNEGIAPEKGGKEAASPFPAEQQAVWKDEEGKPALQARAPEKEAAPAVFDLQKREMAPEKPALLSSEPLKEGKHAEKKPSRKSKKAFYSLHKAIPRKVKKGVASSEETEESD
ncbi:Uncharacterised protein [uncultured archaeon]|nr:Uncharacterised protein [uncultured archaeon]